MSQSFTRTDTEVIQRARRKRRDVIVLREDRTWLADYSTRPKDMLRRMAHRGALIHLGAGRYAIPVIGSNSTAFKAWQPMVDARLAPHGSYYLAGLTALIEHRLTDISSADVYAMIGFRHTQLQNDEIDVAVAGHRIHVAPTRRPVFEPELGVEHVRLSRTERYYRSNLNRTLADCLWHPELCGATETWVTAWGRAASEFDPAEVSRYALALGPAVARRVAVMLELIGHADVAERVIPAKLARPSRPTRLDASAPPVSLERAEIHPRWHVAFNVPRDRVEGWLSYGK